MANRWSVQERLAIARGKLREYEGRLKQLEGRLQVLRGQADQATGKARLRLRHAERDVRGAIDSTLKRLNGVLDVVEPHARRALTRTRVIASGVRSGVKAGAAVYRRQARTK